jgi:maleate isomerase
MPTPVETFSAHKVFLGTITPSGNTVVERVTLAILSAFPEVSPHFSRTPVFGSKDPYPDTYHWDGMLGAARLLAHARPDVLLWNGSKASSIDFNLDRELQDRVQSETGITFTTSILALEEVFKATGVRRCALVTPFDADYLARTIKTFGRAGFECVAEAHSGRRDNMSFSTVTLPEIRTKLYDVAAARPDAIVTLSTNFPGAPVIPEVERELGIPIYDSTSIGVWKALKLAGVDTRRAVAWGRLFEG